jgi:AraC-like DNA-binding protein
MTAKLTCWPRGLSMILEHAIARGVDRRAIERRVGVTLEALRARERRIPLELYYDGVEIAAEMLGKPHFGLDFIDRVEPQTLDALGFLAASAPTIGESFARIFRYFRFMVDGERFELRIDGDDATFTVRMPGNMRDAHAHVVEMYLADCVLLAPRMTGVRPIIRAIELAHPLADPAMFAERIGFADTRHGSKNEWTLDATFLDTPMPRADPALSAFLEGILAQKAEPYLDAALDVKVRALVAERLALGAPSLSEIARELAIAPRTMQRRLAEIGTSYDTLLDDVRRGVFTTCRARGISLEDTAVLCGYSEASSFHRARRRWK